MRLGIFLTRRSSLKVLSPVIVASLARGHDTRLIAEVRAAKKGDRLDLQEVAELYPTARIGSSSDYGQLDALIGIERVLPDLRSLKLIGVDHFFDAWIHAPRTGRNFMMCYHSAYHRDTHRALWPEAPKGVSEVVGWLPADQVRHPVGAEWERARLARDTAVFFSLKRAVPEPWRTSKAGRAFYYHVFCEAQKQAKAEGLRFVVKTRAKNKDPWWLRWLADEVMPDLHVAPATSLSLLSRAKWAVHFESGACFEAALMGAYSVAIAVPQPHIRDLPGGAQQYRWGAVCDPRELPMHAWPGVTQYGFGTGPVPRLEVEARARYLEHFVGLTDRLAGVRVVQVAEGQ